MCLFCCLPVDCLLVFLPSLTFPPTSPSFRWHILPPWWSIERMKGSSPPCFWSQGISWVNLPVRRHRPPLFVYETSRISSWRAFPMSFTNECLICHTHFVHLLRQPWFPLLRCNVIKNHRPLFSSGLRQTVASFLYNCFAKYLLSKPVLCASLPPPVIIHWDLSGDHRLPKRKIRGRILLSLCVNGCSCAESTFISLQVAKTFRL